MSKAKKTATGSLSPAWSAEYRKQRPGSGCAERLAALERHYGERRAELRRANPDSWVVCDAALFQEALALAAAPAASEKEARAKAAFLLIFVRTEAEASGERHVVAMLDEAIGAESRRWNLGIGRRRGGNAV